MRTPRPHTEAWRKWKEDRLPGESYLSWVARTTPEPEEPHEGYSSPLDREAPAMVEEDGGDG